jgi:hypothetical protein
MIAGRCVAGLYLTLALAACDSSIAEPQPTGPEVIVPPGVTSPHRPEEMARRMLDRISRYERVVGRSLAEPRIIRVQLLRPGEVYEARHFDGTNPLELELSPTLRPGWVVEAVGTFTSLDLDPGERPASWGTHGWIMWEDDGAETGGFAPCWSREVIPPEHLDGSCPP